MPRFDPTEFGRLLARLTPQELRQVEGMVAEAREQAEAVLEIDARAETGGPAAACPRCGGGARIRWGRTRTGAQRWSCSGCGATWSGRSGPRPSRLAGGRMTALHLSGNTPGESPLAATGAEPPARL